MKSKLELCWKREKKKKKNCAEEKKLLEFPFSARLSAAFWTDQQIFRVDICNSIAQDREYIDRRQKAKDRRQETRKYALFFFIILLSRGK